MMKIKCALMTLLFFGNTAIFSTSQEVREIVDSLYHDYDAGRVYCLQLAAVARNKEACVRLLKHRIEVGERQLVLLNKNLSSRGWKLWKSIFLNGICCAGVDLCTGQGIPLVSTLGSFLRWPMRLYFLSNVDWRLLDVYKVSRQEKKVFDQLARDKAVLEKVKTIKAVTQ